MIAKLIHKLAKKIAVDYGKGYSLYSKLYHPGAFEYAKYLKKHGNLYHIGENVAITFGTNIQDPQFVRIGNNVALSVCTLIGHDGSIAMLNRAYGVRLDKVGKIDLKDNVFIGYQAIIMPNVTIGPNAIVAAGSVVTKDVTPNDIVGGVPAKSIGKVDELVDRLKEETQELPWANIISQRDGAYDEALEPVLTDLRTKHFFSKKD